MFWHYQSLFLSLSKSGKQWLRGTYSECIEKKRLLGQCQVAKEINEQIDRESVGLLKKL